MVITRNGDCKYAHGVLTGNALTESYVHIRLVYSNNRIDIIGST